MTEDRKYAILFAATLLRVRKLMEFGVASFLLVRGCGQSFVLKA
jgi:hypothetical protein